MSQRVSSPMSGGEGKQAVAALQLSPRLQKCWELDFEWKLIPDSLKKASVGHGASLLTKITSVFPVRILNKPLKPLACLLLQF